MRARRPEHSRITFRSKLEAQWSAIFDSLGLPWAYEPVVFDLPSGRYIPDFKIYPDDKDHCFWVEIKGPWPNAREFEVASEVNIYAGAPLLILSGDVPRQGNGGTAWWFDPARDTWSMLRAAEGLERVIFRGEEQVPTYFDQLWDTALDEVRDAEINPVINRNEER